jgi:epidermal growth factor receptor substrate 15
LADREKTGQFGLTEFIIAMHLLASYKNGSMRTLPNILYPSLYEAAARRGVPKQMTGTRPTSDGVPTSAIPRQFSGSGYAGQLPPRPQQPPFQPGTPTGDQWAITNEEKKKFDQIYATLDTRNQGYITGEQAVAFFGESRLPEEALAQIWDLADINSEGQLNRDEFAVAMYLIRQQRSKRDGRDVLPESLPPNLIPPSMRRQPIAPQQPTAPAFGNAANITAPKSASEDLFGLDAFSSPPPAPIAAGPIPAKATGDSSYAATPPRSQTSPGPLPLQQPPSHFKPFVPSSSFGQTMITPQGTGTSSTASPTVQGRNIPQQQKQVSAMDDLLGDNDPEVSKKLTNETSELANLSNQVSTLSTQMQDVKTQRVSTEHNLSQAQSQKREFEGRLGQLRSAYEQEVREVQALEERLTASRNETKKLQQEMAMIQANHQDLQEQHRQIGEALNADQGENANLKEKIRQANAQIAELKPQTEKMRSDARHQKGLVAINKKQLATHEAELEKIKAELEASAKEHEEAKRELEQSQRDIEAASQAVSQARSAPTSVVSPQGSMASPPPAVASPTPSTASMNPFFRRTSNAAGTERGVTSPFTPQNLTSPNHDAFDSFFGHPAEFSNQPPAQTSFRSETHSDSRDILQQATGESQRSSDGPSIPTPLGTPPPSNFSDSPPAASVPPAPPQSRQITSSFLPLRPNLERSDSESSSTRANPPGSRMGDVTSGFDTPTDRRVLSSEPVVPDSPRDHFEEMAAKAPQGEPSHIMPSFSEQTLSSPMESIRQQEATVSDGLSQSPDFSSASREVPGAFPGDETPVGSDSGLNQVIAGPYSSFKLDPRVDSAPQTQSKNLAVNNSSSHDDPFAMTGNGSRSPAASKEDFDSAFADFGTDKGKAPEHTNGGIPANGFASTEAPESHGEFPPIQEFGADDESDSDDEHGFDDNFTAHSANRTAESGSNQALQNPLVSGDGGLAPTRPSFNTMESNTSQLPTPGAQASPPTYDQTVGPPSEGPGGRKESNQFPAEYSGLLPSRNDPTSPTTSPPPASSVTPAAGIDRGINFFGGDSPEHAAGHAPLGSSFAQEHSPMSPGASNTAPYAYTHSPPPSQVTQTNPPIPAKTAIHDDFDDEFAGLEEAKEASEQGDVDFSSSRRTDFDEFNPVFDSPAASRHTAQSTASTFPPNDAFSDFESSITNTGSASKQKGPTETPAHDWDAIFAGLDTPQNNGVQSDIGPRDFSNSMQSPVPPAGPKLAGKPALNRAETEDGVHDDPILKRLTGMGYPRKESLAALEKFDYNLDKV